MHIPLWAVSVHACAFRVLRTCIDAALHMLSSLSSFSLTEIEPERLLHTLYTCINKLEPKHSLKHTTGIPIPLQLTSSNHIVAYRVLCVVYVQKKIFHEGGSCMNCSVCILYAAYWMWQTILKVFKLCEKYYIQTRGIA